MPARRGDEQQDRSEQSENHFRYSSTIQDCALFSATEISNATARGSADRKIVNPSPHVPRSFIHEHRNGIEQLIPHRLRHNRRAVSLPLLDWEILLCSDSAKASQKELSFK
jgi:hypothetical protein